MNRRSFFGTLLAVLGISKTVEAQTPNLDPATTHGPHEWTSLVPGSTEKKILQYCKYPGCGLVRVKQ